MEKYDDESEVLPDLVDDVSDDEDDEHVHRKYLLHLRTWVKSN